MISLAETLYLAFFKAMYHERYEIKPFHDQPPAYRAIWEAVAQAAAEYVS